MKTKVQVGQIHLTHPKDQNFTALYAEAFRKDQDSVDLFAVIEIADDQPGGPRVLKTEYERLIGLVVAAFKKSYVTSPIIDEDAFERALASVNASLSRSLSRGKVGWFDKFNACLGAVYKNELSLSVAGSGRVFLMRDGELNLLSEDLSETKTRPVKIFSNYATGGLKNRDRVVLATGQLNNYISQERVREYLKEETLGESCQEIITALADVKTISFGAFVCEIVSTAGKPLETPKINVVMPTATSRAATSEEPSAVWSFVKTAASAGFMILEVLWRIVSAIGGAVARLVKKPRPAALGGGRFGRTGRKVIVAAIGLVVIIFLGNIAYGYVKKTLLRKAPTESVELANIDQLLDNAEAAMIYKDEKKAAAAAGEAEKLLAETKGAKPSEKWQSQSARLEAVKNKINKIINVAAPTVLATFPSVPTDLLKSTNGTLAFNRDSGRMAYYDFRSGETKTLLPNENLGRFVAGEYLGGNVGYLFLGREGGYERLDVENQQLTKYEGTNGPKTASQFRILGVGAAARLYLLDIPGNQLWRVRMSDAGPAAPEPWFKSTENLSGVLDLAVDGAIYLLHANGVDKYFNGAKQNFELSPVLPNLSDATAIFASENTQSLYILESAKNRILVYDKTGKLQSQLVSDKFRDGSALFADEANKIIYLLSGSELLQIKY